MFKKISLFCLSLTLSLNLAFLFTRIAYSQEPPTIPEEQTFEDAYEEYIKASEEYNRTHEDYVLKRAQYQRFQTLRSRQDAFDATLKMLQSRDDVVISYLRILKAKIIEGIGVPDARLESLLFRMDEEITWYADHKANIPSSGSLDDLVSDSDLAETQWRRVGPIAYETMSTLSFGKMLVFTDRTKEIFDASKTKIEAIRQEEREGYTFSANKFSILDRWMLEADGRLGRSAERLTEAERLIDDLSPLKKDSQGQHTLIITELSEAQIFLKEVNSFVKEVIRQIKTAED